MKCDKCNDTGVIETGNNDLPCDCAMGDTALFNDSFVKGGPITGAELKRHFLNDSPEPIKKTIDLSELPGRKPKKETIREYIQSNIDMFKLMDMDRPLLAETFFGLMCIWHPELKDKWTIDMEFDKDKLWSYIALTAANLAEWEAKTAHLRRRRW